jgi:hypothetical protein
MKLNPTRANPYLISNDLNSTDGFRFFFYFYQNHFTSYVYQINENQRCHTYIFKAFFF